MASVSPSNISRHSDRWVRQAMRAVHILHVSASPAIVCLSSLNLGVEFTGLMELLSQSVRVCAGCAVVQLEPNG